MTGLVRAMIDAAEPVPVPAEVQRPAGRHLRDRRRPQRDDQHLDHGRVRGGRRRRAGLQARQPSAVVQVGLGRRARGARRRHRPRARRAWPAASRRPASASASRPRSTRRCATPGRPVGSSACRPCSTSSARWPTRPGSAARWSASATRPWPRRCSACWPGQRGRPHPGRLRPRRPRRAHHHRHARRCSSSADGEVRTYVVDPMALGLHRRRPTNCGAPTRPTNADVARRVLGGEKGPHRDIVLLNAAAGHRGRGPGGRRDRGWPKPPRSVDGGRAEQRLADWSRCPSRRLRR